MKKGILKKRNVLVITTFLLVTSLLMTGTFAWQAVSQQAINRAVGRPGAPLLPGDGGGRLHDDYEVVDNWTQGRTANKDVYIENFGVVGDEPIFVRIMLYEFMAYSNIAWPSTNDNDVLQAHFVANGQSLADNANVAINNPFTWAPRTHWAPCLTGGVADTVADPFRQYWTWELGGQKWFMPTFNRDPGSLQSDVKGDAVDPQAGLHPNPTANTNRVWPGGGWTGSFPPQAGLGNFWDPANPHWDGNPNPYWWAEERTPGGTFVGTTHHPRQTLYARVITMAQWETGMPATATAPAIPPRGQGHFWVVDADGWAYWAAPLLPGEATGLLLSSITLANLPGQYWYYAIFIDAQMSTAEEWVDAFTNNNLTGVRNAMTSDAVDLLTYIAGPGASALEITTSLGQTNVVLGTSIYFGSPFANTEWTISPAHPEFLTGTFNAHGSTFTARFGPTSTVAVGTTFTVTATEQGTGRTVSRTVPVVAAP